MTTFEYKDLLDSFLERWPFDSIVNMTLEEYVGVKNRDTFCQWVETRTRRLGSIKGLTSIKFGIYERENPAEKPKNYRNDDQYSWLMGYGSNRIEAFENTKRDIVRIIQLSETGKFNEIDDLILPDLYKWKVAFLYSNERLIPIYSRKVLIRIVNHFGLPATDKTPVSTMQEVMMANKPAHLDVYVFMHYLMERFGDTEDRPENSGPSEGERERRNSRQAAQGRDTDTQTRSGSRSYVAEQRHNKLQLALEALLIEQYGKENVKMEENFVDIRLIQPESITLYEVKAAPYASACIQQALGQVLMYSWRDSDSRPKKHVVVGQYPPTREDLKYIDFLKRNLRMEFDYINIALE